jgi:hypothetical protein
MEGDEELETRRRDRRRRRRREMGRTSALQPQRKTMNVYTKRHDFIVTSGFSTFPQNID